ncbi:MAG: serine/threonine protein kinase [Magnetococcus sp. YQC-9]
MSARQAARGLLMIMPATLGRWCICSSDECGWQRGILRGRDPVEGREVLIKTVPFPLWGCGEGRIRAERLRQEGVIVARLAHPSIVQLLDQGEEREMPFMVFDWQPEASLRDRLASGWRPDQTAALAIMIQLLTGVAHVHDYGYRHGDLKPSNLLMTAEGGVQIADFGAACRLDMPPAPEGRVTGTHGFMPPEQLMGLAVDGRADLFAVGVILFELLTGVKPFIGGDFREVTLRVLSFTPPELEREGLLWMLMRRALAKKPEKRFESAKQFLDAIRTLAVEC